VSGLDDLIAVVARLRGDGGCPWDRAQTEGTLRPYLLEEAHEALEAIDRGDANALKEELGDLLFIVTLLARMAEERGEYGIADVASGIAAKMVARHPHVFDPAHVRTGDEGGIEAWEARKARAREGRSALDGVPDALPALLRAHRIGEKASKVGFDWPDRSGVRKKVAEELQELDEALAGGDEAQITEEFGDLLFALANLGRFLPVSSEDALRMAIRKFEKRFRAVEEGARADGVALHDLGAEALEARWQRVKNQ
jgi:MazG family protein